MNNNLQNITESATVKLADEVRRRKGLGLNLFELQTGDPDFSTAPEINDACNRALADGMTHYSFSKGEPKLREAIVQKLYSKNKIVCDINEVVVTHGGIHAYHCIMSVLLNPGDEVLIADPSWMSHYNVVKNNRGVTIAVLCSEAENYIPSIENFESRITDKTRAILINFPANPTGAVPSIEYFKRLYALAEKHDLYIVSDEVYEYILFNGHQHFSIGSLEAKARRVITFNSFSKTFAMTGWRLGYIVASEMIIKEITKILQCTITNVPPFIQAAGHEALTSRKVSLHVNDMLSVYKKRYDKILKLAEEFPSNFRFNRPAGAFYFWIDIRMTGFSSEIVAMKLLEEKNVAVVPGHVFGKNGEGYLRMTFAASDDMIERGMNAMKEWALENK